MNNQRILWGQVARSSIGALGVESGRQEMALVPDEPAQTAVADERVVCAAHTKELAAGLTNMKRFIIVMQVSARVL